MDERILALDVGDARIGIAVSDPTRTLAQPVEVLQRKGWGPDYPAYPGALRCLRYAPGAQRSTPEHGWHRRRPGAEG